MRNYNNVQYLKIMCFLNIKACQHILLHQIITFKASNDPFNVYFNAMLCLIDFHCKCITVCFQTEGRVSILLIIKG